MPRIKDVVDSVAVQVGVLFSLNEQANICLESSEIFTRIIQIWQQPLPDHCNQFKAFLDAGCYAGDLISSEVIAIIGCQDQVHPEDKIIGICLHGHPLRSLGTVVLRWEGVGFYKVFETLFHVVEGNSLPWQVILGANTCAKHNLLTIGAAAFGGSCTPVFPKKEKSEFAVYYHHAIRN